MAVYDGGGVQQDHIRAFLFDEAGNKNSIAVMKERVKVYNINHLLLAIIDILVNFGLMWPFLTAFDFLSITLGGCCCRVLGRTRPEAEAEIGVRCESSSRIYIPRLKELELSKEESLEDLSRAPSGILGSVQGVREG